MSRYWYSYKGVAFDPLLASSYTLLPGNPACETGTVICAIYSPGDEFPNTIANPSNLHDYISAALGGDQVPQPVGSKKFVYLRAS